MLARVVLVAAVAAAGCAHPSMNGDEDLGHGRGPDLAGRDLAGRDLSTSGAGDLSSGGCPGKNLQTDPMNCGACGHACMGAHVMTNACSGGNCGIGMCAPGYYDVNTMGGDGCECKQDAAETMASSQCAGAASGGEVTDAMPSMITLQGNIVPLTDEDWYEIKSTDSPDNGCNKYHLQIKFAANPMSQFRFDVFYDDCSTKGSCAGMGEGPLGLTSYDFDANGAMDGGECPCSSGKPNPGEHVCMDHSQTLRLRVYRAMNLPLSCDDYKLEVSNGM